MSDTTVIMAKKTLKNTMFILPSIPFFVLLQKITAQKERL